MPRHSRMAGFGMIIASSAMAGAAVGQDKSPILGHHNTKAKPHSGSTFAQASGGGMRMDDWFSLGPLKEAEIEKEAPGVQIKVHDPHEDDIIVYGQRQKRDFEGATPAANLTSPQALDAAQPAYVPSIGDSCTYKYGCFDNGQTPLRSSLFGD